MNTARYIGSRSESNLRGPQFDCDRTTLPVNVEHRCDQLIDRCGTDVVAAAFLQRAGTACVRAR